MKKRLVVACFGDAVSTAAVAHHAETADVIGAALDVTGAVALCDARDAALAAGAVRCHALDVREQFLRDVVLPALRHTASPADAYTAFAPAFVTAKLRELARLENADYVPVSSDSIVLPARRRIASVVAPAHLEIRVEAGVPVAVNGVEMSLTELVDSLETITGESALAVLSRYMNPRVAAAAGDVAGDVRDHQFA